MTPFATSTFLEVLFASFIVIPVMLLCGAAVFDVVRRGEGGVKVAGILVLILIVPILGPILYFAFRPPPRVSAEDAYLAQADQRRQAAARPMSPGV
jgi:hypothetical protein